MNYFKRFFSRKQTLAEQLAECCDTIVTMAKRGERIHTDGEVDYKYLRILDLANGLRGELLQRKILLIPNDTECQAYADNGITEYRVKTEFTFTNGRENVTTACYGVGQNSDGTALSVAQTMALKALLKRMGLIFGEEDDQELGVGAGDSERVSAHEHDKQAKRKNTVTTRQMTKFHNAAVLSGKPTAMIAIYLQEHFGILQMSDLPKEKFEEALAWAMGTEDLTATLANSLEVVNKRGPERVA
jgi:hypothetical protein